MSLVDRFITGSYKITRTSSGRYDKGFYVKGPTECFEMMGSLQPTNGRELKQVEEGYRVKESWSFYSNDPLIAQNVPTLGASDIVQINGESYRVLNVEIWQHMDINYYKSILTRTPETIGKVSEVIQLEADEK